MTPVTAYVVYCVIAHLLVMGAILSLTLLSAFKQSKNYKRNLFYVKMICVMLPLFSIAVNWYDWKNIKAGLEPAPEQPEYKERLTELKKQREEVQARIDALKIKMADTKDKLKEIGVNIPPKPLLERGTWELQVDGTSDNEEVSEVMVKELMNKGVKNTIIPDEKALVFSELTEADAQRIKGLLEKAGAKVKMSARAP